MKSVLYLIGVAALTALGLSGCSMLKPGSSAVLQADVAEGVACAVEVQSAAPACIAEVPSCVALGKAVASHK